MDNNQISERFDLYEERLDHYKERLDTIEEELDNIKASHVEEQLMKLSKSSLKWAIIVGVLVFIETAMGIYMFVKGYAH